MAVQTKGSSHAPSAQIVGNLFVERYYLVLHTSPDQVHKFYQDSSVISRPDLDGEMTSVKTMQGINKKILSFDFKDYKTEILTADAQESYNKGVIVLVTGCLTGKNNVRKIFTQTFFLARQDNVYYVLNDVFRFVKVDESVGVAENSPIISGPPDPEPAHVPDHVPQSHTSTPVEEVKVSNNDEKVCDPADTKLSVDEVVVASSSRNDVRSPAESASTVQEDVQKISYASIVVKESTMTSPVQVATSSTVRVPPSSSQQQSRAPAAPKMTAPQSNASQSSNGHIEVKGIYIGNLPTGVTVQQLEATFKIFGPIKRDSIQIRQFKEDGFCYGFVDFESSNSAISALQARRITIGNQKAYIEEKRTFARADNGRRKFPSGRGGFRNDNYRGAKKYGGGHEYSKYDYGNRGEFSGQASGPTGNNGVSYRRGFQNGGGRGAHHGGME